MVDVFISYASADKVVTEAVDDGLRSAGFSVWRDRSRLLGGDDFSAEITSAINSARAVVAIISPAAAISGWVSAEIAAARGKLIPCLIERFEFPLALNASIGGLNHVDLTETIQAGDQAPWMLLVRSVEAMLGRSATSLPPPKFTQLPPSAKPPERSNVIINTGKMTGVVGEVHGDANFDFGGKS
jgi:hypothetical protein